MSKTNTTLQHFTTLHHTSPNYTSRHLSTLHFLSFTLHFPLIWLNPLTLPIALFHLTSLNYTQYSSHLQTYFQHNEPLHCPKEPLAISLHFTSLHFTSLHFTSFHFTSLPFSFFILFNFLSLILSTLHFTLLCYYCLQLTSLYFTFLHFLLFIAFTSPHWFSLF
jgi:hypothetical protein